MIKKLIQDIAYDAITVEQALTRAKILAHQIKDDTFSKWVSSELEGYDEDRKLIRLPEYRILPCQVEGALVSRFGESGSIPILAPEVDKMLDGMLYKLRVNNGIPNLERSLIEIKSDTLHMPLPLGMAQKFTEELGLMKHGHALREVYWKVPKSQMADIILQTKQTLLDTLLTLNDKFPEMNDEFQPSKEEKEQINQVITNNIYGSHNVTTVGIGQEITQNVSVQLFQQQLNAIKEKLKEYGVQDSDIIDLEQSIEPIDDEKTIRKKVMKWVAELGQKTLEKGIEYKLPEIIDAISGLLN